MEITARLTSDAKIMALKNERQVVNFNVAINDSYKPKDSDEIKRVTTFIRCAYWINPTIAKHLTKGTLVGLHGRIGVTAYKNMQGEPKASLTFHANNIKLHGRSRSTEVERPTASTVPVSDSKGPSEDLPF